MVEIVCKDCGKVIAECDEGREHEGNWNYAPCGELICDDCCDSCYDNHEPCGECAYRGR